MTLHPLWGSIPRALAASRDPASLRSELDRLNHELRDLPSARLAARTYFQAWFGCAALAVAGKLHFDASRLGKVSWLALVLVVAGAAVLLGVVRRRREVGRMRVAEDEKLARQRELRRELGLDEARFPLDPA